MTPSDRNEIFLSSSPSIRTKQTTRKIMLVVLAMTAPLCVSGVMRFGLNAAATILASVASCVIFEAIFRKLTNQESHAKDFSAAVTGVLLALTLPPSMPVPMTILGALFAVVVAKEFFGGIGANVFNPALAGRAFLFLSFPQAMGTWTNPVDASSCATPLSSGVYPALQDMIFGNMPGCIGETFSLWIIAAFVIMVAVGIIDWQTPLIFSGTVVLYSALFAGVAPLDSLLSGGLLFGAVFMATDYATTPVTFGGKVVFALGCGLITSLIRHFSGYPEGVMFSILIMNALTGFLDKILPREYGFVAVKKGASK